VGLSRRWFLKGTLAVAATAVIALPPLASPHPIVYGDGIHDDTAALNALFARLPVICEGSLIERAADEPVLLEKGVFLISGPLVVQGRTIINGCRFKAVRAGPYLDLRHADHSVVMNNIFESFTWRPSAAWPLRP
jgi:hypothetical protein